MSISHKTAAVIESSKETYITLSNDDNTIHQLREIVGRAPTIALGAQSFILIKAASDLIAIDME